MSTDIDHAESKIFIRRQSIALSRDQRQKLIQAAKDNHTSLSQYIVAKVAERIQTYKYYAEVSAFAQRILEIAPEAHKFGEELRKSHKQPAKSRSQNRASLLSLPVPVKLNLEISLIATIHQSSSKEVIRQLAIDGCFSSPFSNSSPNGL